MLQQDKFGREIKQNSLEAMMELNIICVYLSYYDFFVYLYIKIFAI